ncbi:AzlD domain-containing protein [Brevibacillus sp. SYP-B805]|uniref:AzlD domain-containing protein n=1 Tax=Brevibacillus sp. SYP-B805 TaxID=1578199 RepID=UPI0013ECCC14|nr:AzlD domain-containing protein [Brevibacillus sp. SYP-B805]NGQ95405.1 AzlD domain-containing protein [Brevibacillus sp. SYP-B805]
MTTLDMLLLYAGGTAVTYLARRAFLRLPDNFFSPRLKNGLTFIPIGIFAGLIFPSIFVQGGTLVWQPLFLIASAVCVGTMMLFRNVFVSFGASLALVVLVSLFT